MVVASFRSPDFTNVDFFQVKVSIFQCAIANFVQNLDNKPNLSLTCSLCLPTFPSTLPCCDFSMCLGGKFKVPY